jgi:hypothetical protein
LQCTQESLIAALPYQLQDTLPALLSIFSIECGHMFAPVNWTNAPQVNFNIDYGRVFCWGNDHRKQREDFNCGQGVGNEYVRICCCDDAPTTMPTTVPTEVPTATPSTAVPTAIPTTMPTSIALSPGYVSIDISVTGELLRLTSVSRLTGIANLAGRSYDGNPWESAPPLLFLFDCDGVQPTCDVAIPGDDGEFFYQIEPTYSVPIPGERAMASEFLTTTTFGPTKDSIHEYINDKNSDPALWMEAQMAIPETLHRAYFRRRSSPPLPVNSGTGFVMSACADGSRWSRFAIAEVDIAKTIEVLDNIVFVSWSIHVSCFLQPTDYKKKLILSFYNQYLAPYT